MIPEGAWRRFLINADLAGRRKGGVLGPVGKSEWRATKIVCPRCGSASCGEVRAGYGIGLSITPEPIEKPGATVRETLWTFTCGRGKCAHSFSERATLVIGRIAHALTAGDRQVAVER